MSIGTRMASARKERGMTQAQLAEHLKIKQATVSMLETGELDPEDVGEGLIRLVQGWLESGAGPRKKAPRGPYKTRSTLPVR